VLIKHRNFRIFWFGQTGSLVGTWMQQVALGWVVLQITNSPFLVGVEAAAGSLPVLLFTLYAGVLADRMDKLVLVRVTQSLLLFEATLLWWFNWTGHVTIAVLIGIAVVRRRGERVRHPDATGADGGARGARRTWSTRLP